MYTESSPAPATGAKFTAPTVRYTVTVGKSTWTAARPCVVVHAPGASAQVARTALAELAAEVERVLAETQEPWKVGHKMYDGCEDIGCVYLETIGDEAEAQRAVAMLESAAAKANGGAS